MKKVLLSLSAFLLFIGLSVPSVNAQGPQELHFDTMDEFNEALKNGMFSESNDDNDIAPAAVGPAVAVFVGGILVGFVVDGVVIYSTGFSSSQWVAIGIAYFSCFGSNKYFYLDRVTGETACYTHVEW